MDNNNHAKDSDASHITSTVRAISTNLPKKPLIPKRAKQGLMIFVVVLLLAGLVAGGVYLFTQQKNNQPNTLSNKRVYDEAIKSYNSFPGVSNLSTEDRAKLDAETKPQYLAGYVTGFGPNANEIEGAKFLLGPSPAPVTISGYINSIIASKKEMALKEGYYQGYFLYFWYGRTISNKAEGEIIENYGDSTALESDKNYAKSKADDILQKLQQGQLDAKTAAEELSKDKRLALNDETNGSGFFMTNTQEPTSSDRDGRLESVNKVLKKQTKPGLSEIGVITADPGVPRSGVKRDVGYFVIYLEYALVGQGSIDIYDQQLKIAKEMLK